MGGKPLFALNLCCFPKQVPQEALTGILEGAARALADSGAALLGGHTVQDDELKSAPIHAGEFASFCQLKPGRYRYKVVTPDPTEKLDARRRIWGEIIVGEPDKKG